MHYYVPPYVQTIDLGQLPKQGILYHVRVKVPVEHPLPAYVHRDRDREGAYSTPGYTQVCLILHLLLAEKPWFVPEPKCFTPPQPATMD